MCLINYGTKIITEMITNIILSERIVIVIHTKDFKIERFCT